MKDPRAVRKLASSYDRRNNVPLAKFSRLSPTTWDEHVTSVLCDGEVHHGFTVDRLGVFINEDNFTGTPVVKKFAGRIVKNCNREVPRLGVLTLSQRGGNSYNFFERGPFGEWHGRDVRALSDRTVYSLYERGLLKASAVLHASGRWMYNEMMCPPYHPPLVAFIAEVNPVKALATAVAREAEEAVANLPLRLAGLELLATVLLARNRPPQPAVAAGVPFAAELISLPSGLLSMVCEAIVALKVSDVARARPDSCSTGPLRRSSRLSTLRAMASA